MTITTHSKTEAECVAKALEGFDCEIADGPRGWDVIVGADDDAVRVLTALESCVRANGIASVKVTLHGRTYAMEGA